MAPATIGVGPGFTTRYRCNIVVESMRGHNLGRLITKGAAITITGIPGRSAAMIRQVIHASGVQIYRRIISKISDLVE